MSQRHYIVLAGPTTVEVTDRVPLEGWELTEKAEEGAVGSGTMWLADPDMDLDIDGLRNYYVLEDASEATDNVLFGGFAIDPELSRGEQGGMFYDPVARNWQIQLTDRNGFWNRRVMVGADCKRPAETDVERMQWLFGSSEANWIEDDTTYMSTASAANMDKNDYRGQYLNQIVDDAAQASTVGKNWWVQLQETGTGRQDVAWYGRDGLTTYTSSLYLTNDPAHWAEEELIDGTSVVWPISDDTRARRDLSRVYTGVYIRYDSGRKAIYRYNATSGAVYGRRDHVADYPNVRTKAKAEVRATRLLNELAEPDERITTTVELPAAKATMIRAGMRVQFKATHLVGYTTWQYLRVLECKVTPIAAGTRYRLSLVLQGSGATAGGGPPFTGDAFAGFLKRYDQDDPTSPEDFLYVYSGDQAPPSGWYEEPTVGNMWTYNGTDGQWESITTSVAITVRIQAQNGFYQVSQSDADYATLQVLVNGSVIASETAYRTGNAILYAFDVNVPSYDLAAGDVVSVRGVFSGVGNGWTSGDTQLSALRVGRGTQAWNNDQVTWVGP
jgi:hypothetical protein